MEEWNVVVELSCSFILSLAIENGGTRRACSPSRKRWDDLFSKESRRAWPVHIPWVPVVRFALTLAES